MLGPDTLRLTRAVLVPMLILGLVTRIPLDVSLICGPLRQIVKMLDFFGMDGPLWTELYSCFVPSGIIIPVSTLAEAKLSRLMLARYKLA